MEFKELFFSSKNDPRHWGVKINPPKKLSCIYNFYSTFRVKLTSKRVKTTHVRSTNNPRGTGEGAGSEVWNRVYVIAPVKKFGRVRLSTIFLQNKYQQIWRRMQTWRDDEFLLGFEFSCVQTTRKGFQEYF